MERIGSLNARREFDIPAECALECFPNEPAADRGFVVEDLSGDIRAAERSADFAMEERPCHPTKREYRR
jgi:hypothetical protein